jgi:hypothetical protein
LWADNGFIPEVPLEVPVLVLVLVPVEVPLPPDNMFCHMDDRELVPVLDVPDVPEDVPDVPVDVPYDVPEVPVDVPVDVPVELVLDVLLVPVKLKVPVPVVPPDIMFCHCDTKSVVLVPVPPDNNRKKYIIKKVEH